MIKKVSHVEGMSCAGIDVKEVAVTPAPKNEKMRYKLMEASSEFLEKLKLEAHRMFKSKAKDPFEEFKKALEKNGHAAEFVEKTVGYVKSLHEAGMTAEADTIMSSFDADFEGTLQEKKVEAAVQTVTTQAPEVTKQFEIMAGEVSKLKAENETLRADMTAMFAEQRTEKVQKFCAEHAIGFEPEKFEALVDKTFETDQWPVIMELIDYTASLVKSVVTPHGKLTKEEGTDTPKGAHEKLTQIAAEQKISYRKALKDNPELAKLAMEYKPYGG